MTVLGPKDGMKKHTWKKRWFLMKDNYLYYYETREDEIPIGAINLSNAKVKVASNPGRNHAFEIVTGMHLWKWSLPDAANRDYLIAADDSADMFSWMNCIRDSISFYASGNYEDLVVIDSIS
jgi:cytohesin